MVTTADQPRVQDPERGPGPVRGHSLSQGGEGPLPFLTREG